MKFKPILLTMLALSTAFPPAAWAMALTAEAAAQAQNEFRLKYLGRIEQQGWQFITSAGALEWPDGDVFIQDIRRKDGAVRSAWVLVANYELVTPWLNLKPPYQSTRALYWFDCSDHSFEYRQGATYLNPDGTGIASEPTVTPTSQPAKFQESAPGSLLRLLAKKACE